MPDRLGDARRANGARIESERRSYDNAAARRAIGRRIESERRGSAVQAEINSLIRPEQARRTLRTVEPLGALPSQRGRGNYKAPASTGGAGVAWPLTEADFTKRVYYDDGVLSSDGTVMMPLIKTIELTDANGEINLIHLAAPL